MVLPGFYQVYYQVYYQSFTRFLLGYNVQALVYPPCFNVILIHSRSFLHNPYYR